MAEVAEVAEPKDSSTPTKRKREESLDDSGIDLPTTTSPLIKLESPGTLVGASCSVVNQKVGGHFSLLSVSGQLSRFATLILRHPRLAQRPVTVFHRPTKGEYGTNR